MNNKFRNLNLYQESDDDTTGSGLGDDMDFDFGDDEEIDTQTNDVGDLDDALDSNDMDIDDTNSSSIENDTDSLPTLPTEYTGWLDKATEEDFNKSINIPNEDASIKLFNKDTVESHYKQDKAARNENNNKCFSDVFVAIGSDNDGNILLINTLSNTISLWDHSTMDQKIVAKSWDEFMGIMNSMDSNETTDNVSNEEPTEDTESEEDFKSPFAEMFSCALKRRSTNIIMESADEDDEEEDDDDKETSVTEVEVDVTDDNDDDNDDDLSSFGTDNSDIQNDFNPKDIEIVNKLIAAESEAINDYFDAAKDSHDENLTRLYGDIGHEERFHLEQLLYAKSTITGEKYVPRDDAVKAEYEELLQIGMDEETAAMNAIDKASMNDTDDGDDSDVKEIEQECALIHEYLLQNEVLYNAAYEEYSHKKLNQKVNTFIESYVMEAVDNATTAPKQITKIQNPLTLLAKGLKGAINGILRLGNTINNANAKNKVKMHRKMEWIRNHGVADLFKSGISLYYYDDKKSQFDLEKPIQYVDLLYRLSRDIGNKCGIKLTKEATHGTYKHPIKYGSVEDGLSILKGAIFEKTKVVVTDNNKDILARQFFGYSDDKVNVDVKTPEGDVIKQSGNIYNRLNIMMSITKDYADISLSILDEMSKLEGDMASIYYKNRPLYNKSVEQMKLIVNKYTQFINTMSHDLTTILKLNNGILERTNARDKQTQTTNEPWTGADERVPGNKPQNHLIEK